MSKITNHSQVNVSFVTGAKDGAAQVESVKPGETKSIAGVSAKDRRVAIHIAMGAISVEGTKAIQPVAPKAD